MHEMLMYVLGLWCMVLHSISDHVVSKNTLHSRRYVSDGWRTDVMSSCLRWCMARRSSTVCTHALCEPCSDSRLSQASWLIKMLSMYSTFRALPLTSLMDYGLTRIAFKTPGEANHRAPRFLLCAWKKRYRVRISRTLQIRVSLAL